MRRTSKVIALCLLLSIAVSVFAVFSFGADATMSPTTIYDMEKALGNSNGTIAGDAENHTVRGEKATQLVYKTDDKGNPYYQHRVLGEYDAEAGIYKNPNVSTNVYFQAAGFGGKSVLVDSQKYGSKNTDFLVIDFDFSTDGTFGDYFYFQNRWYTESGGNSQLHYPRFDGGTIDESLTFSTYDAANSIYTSDKLNLESVDNTGWVNVTLVYDFRGQDRSQWKAYAYLDGKFAGAIGTVKSDAVASYLTRFVYDTTFSAPEATVNLANYTMKVFPVDYNGELATEVNNLGKAGVDLGNFADLQYCLEDKPETKVATVERGDEVIDVYSYLALDASLMDGDKVTLYRDITKSLVVPKGANIEWNDNNRFRAPVSEVDYSLVNVVLRDLKTGAILGYANDPIVGITTLYDQNTASAPPSYSNNNTSLSYAKKTDSYGRVYWSLGAPDSTNLDTRGPWHYLGLNQRKLSLADTKYFIIDVDIKVSANTFDTIDFNLRCYNGSTSVSGNGAFSPTYVVKDGKVGVAQSANRNVAFYSDATVGEWANLTVVYDLTAESYEDWKLYAYIDGVYAGVLSSGFKDVTDFYFIRIQPKAANSADATTDIANWSIKAFDSTYNGKLADQLASSSYTLTDIPDLAYCVENDYDEEPEEDNTPIVGITTSYDQNTKSIPSWANKTASGIKYTKGTDAYGRTYWTVSATDATAVIGGGGGEWHQVSATATLSSTNYIVIDMDIKAGEHTFGGFYYNMRFYNGTSSKDSTDDFYYTIQDGKIGFKNDGKTAEFVADYAGGWAHLTVVYDFTGSSYKEWKAYGYVNGAYVGVITGSLHSAAATLKDIRFQTDTAATEADATTSFANWTVKVFDNTYNGKLGMYIGDDNYNLSQIKDLAYCLEDVIDTEPPAEEPEEEETTAVIETTSLEKAIEKFGALFDLRLTLLSNATLANTEQLAVGKLLVFDLGGKTLKTVSSAHSFVLSSTIIFNNGKIVDENIGNFNVIIISDGATKARAIFNGADAFVEAKHPFIEQRAGVVSFNGSVINADKAGFISMRGGNVKTALVVKNSKINAATDAIFVANTSKSNVMQGSLNNSIVIDNSEIVASGSVLNIRAYANENGSVKNGVFTPAAGFGDNNNVVDIVVAGSKLTAGGAAIYSEIYDIRVDAHDLDGDKENDVFYADNFKFVTNASISNTEMTAAYVVEQYIAPNGMLPEAFGMRSAQGYTFTSNVNLDTVEIKGVAAIATKNVQDSADEINILASGECVLSTNKMAADGTVGVSMNTANGYYLVPRSAEGAAPYAVTNNVTPYPYIINGDEYEFYWYGDDPVKTELIPVDITSNSPYVSFKWADELDVNGAYFLETVVTVPLKANMSLGSNFGFNLYLPADMSADTYETIKINGTRAKLANINIDGVDYKVVTINGISPVNAAEAFDLSFTVYTDDGLSASATKRISIIDYAKGVLKSTTEGEESKELIASLVNYIAKVYAVAGRTNAALADVLNLNEYKAITLAKETTATAKSTIDALGAFETVGLTAGGDFRFSFRTTEGFNGNLVFTYYKNGQRFMETVMVRGGDVITLDMKAYDLLSDITVRYNGTSGEYNLAAYIEALVEMEADFDMLELADALWIFAERAAAYKAA